MSMRVLVTGASGFAGRHLIQYGLQSGATMIGQSRRADSIAGLPLVSTDLADLTQVVNLVSQATPNWIIHLAAQTPANTPDASPQSWLTTNPVYTINLLEAARQYVPNARILIVSSSAVYGHVPEQHMPMSETLPLKPTTLYGVSKAAQELLAIRYATEIGLHVVRARPFNQVGPGEPVGMLTTQLARQIANITNGQAEPVVRLRHRTTSRDYTDIRDTIRAYWALCEYGHSGSVYNVCSGTATPIGMILDHLLQYAGIQVDIEETHPNPAPGDILCQVGSTTALHQVTGWQPLIDLPTSLATLLDTYRVR